MFPKHWDAGSASGEGGQRLRSRRRFAETRGQHVSIVMVARRDAVAFFRQLATAGRGEFVEGVGGQSMIASVLLAILDV